jgi:hypothetical protein
MNDIAKFYRLKTTVEEQERIKDNAKRLLKNAYSELVKICPHSEAIDHDFNRRQGVFRVCKICGIEDHASEGGTPGDEYNYGYPGSPSREFWKHSEIEKTDDEKYFWTFRRQHGWQVRDGKVWSWETRDK